MTYPSEPTLGEIARQIETLRADVRTALDERLRADVYRAEQRLVEERLVRVEARLTVADEDRKRLRGMVAGAAITAGLSVVAQLAAGLIQSAG